MPDFYRLNSLVHVVRLSGTGAVQGPPDLRWFCRLGSVLLPSRPAPAPPRFKLQACKTARRAVTVETSGVSGPQQAAGASRHWQRARLTLCHGHSASRRLSRRGAH